MSTDLSESRPTPEEYVHRTLMRLLARIAACGAARTNPPTDGEIAASDRAIDAYERCWSAMYEIKEIRTDGCNI